MTIGIAKSGLIECKHCGCEFDLRSPYKRRVGGKINECSDCVESLGTETAVTYAGVAAGDGKGVGVTVLAFESASDRDSYVKAWRSNCGQHRGKACQMGNRNSYMGGLKFKKIGESGSIGTNHKGRL
jgi:hypothetical protein